MSDARPVGVVVDTMVISWLLEGRADQLTDQYRALIDTRRVLLAFQTVMELRYGAMRAGWGDLRRRRLERRIAELVVVQPDDAMIAVCARAAPRLPQARAPARRQSLTTAIAGSPRLPSGSACRSCLTIGSSESLLASSSSPPTPRTHLRVLDAPSGIRGPSAETLKQPIPPANLALPLRDFHLRRR